jgi:environmental stress-induced protein Ves
MGQNRKLEVLGWGLVINWDDDTCVAFNGNTCVCTTNDAIEVRAFNPMSNIQAWMLLVVCIIVSALLDNITNIFPKEEIK